MLEPLIFQCEDVGVFRGSLPEGQGVTFDGAMATKLNWLGRRTGRSATVQVMNCRRQLVCANEVFKTSAAMDLPALKA